MGLFGEEGVLERSRTKRKNRKLKKLKKMIEKWISGFSEF
jgi:hypothetical protein